MTPEKKTLIEAYESAKELLEERRWGDQRLPKLLDEIRSGAKARSAAFVVRSHDYWGELAEATMPLRTLLLSLKEGKFDAEPTHELTKKIDAFLGAAEDAAKEAP